MEYLEEERNDVILVGGTSRTTNAQGKDLILHFLWHVAGVEEKDIVPLRSIVVLI